MMKWHTTDLPLLLLHLPRAVQDLLHHEDPHLVKAELSKIQAKTLTAPLSGTAGIPLISVEKALDPLAQRSAQNIGLLMHDYLNQLSAFDVSKAEGDALLEHWRKIILEQPERLASAHPEHWRDDRLKAYWQDKLAGNRTQYGISEGTFVEVWDDWRRASGIGHITGNPLQMQAMSVKQWQDMVIRTRMHQKSMEPSRDC